LSADDRSELRLEGINLARQLDGAEQLGPLADNAAQLAGFVRRKLAFCDARKEIAEYLSAILCRLQRPSARSACLRAAVTNLAISRSRSVSTLTRARPFACLGAESRGADAPALPLTRGRRWFNPGQ